MVNLPCRKRQITLREMQGNKTLYAGGKMPKILYLLDGHAIAYRSYFALTSGGATRWATSTGEPTAGVYGFAAMLLRILEQEQPDYLAVAFDTGRTFRHDLYEDYKGTRAKMPDDLRAQLGRMRELVDAFNIPRIELENYEADDVIGSLAVWAAGEEGLGVKIVTGDRDLLQLVTNRIIVSLPGKSGNSNDDYFPEDVKKRMGVLPEQVVDYKALVGDPSDNIPGVRGIGDKTAINLINSYHDLDQIYENLDQITGRAGKALREGKEMAYLSQDLARIRTDLNLRLDLNQARSTCFEPEAVEELFKTLEFRTLTQRLQALVKKMQPCLEDKATQGLLFEDSTSPAEQPVLIQASSGTQIYETVIVDTPQKLQSVVEELNQADLLAFDTETTNLDPLRAKLVGISLAAKPDKGYYFPVGHREGQNLSLADVQAALGPLLKDAKIAKAAHNAKYDLMVLQRHGMDVHPIRFDSMIAEWLCNPDSRMLGLKSLAWIKLNEEMTHIEDLIGKGKNQKTMDQVSIEAAAPYAAADAVMTLRLIAPLTEALQEHKAEALFENLEMKLIPVLAEMEENGILLDEELFEVFGKELDEDIAQLEAEIYQLAGETFNIASPAQLGNILYKKLNLVPPGGSRKTSTGKLSTAASVLEEMRKDSPIVDLILQYRELSKLKSTYVDALPLQVDPQDGRVHTSFNQVGTVTGRIASQNPNLQNIPTRTELGRRVRQGFIAPKGKLLLAVDYSQVELRIMAHIAQDKAMLEAFKRSQDIHATTAAAIFNIALEDVSKSQRRHAKAINFGLIYGMSPFGLTRSTDLTLAEAENFVAEYFKEFPGVKAWLDHTRMLAAQQGYVETLLGRRRYFPNLKAGTNYMMRQREEREAINAPIQGTAADIMKLAMLALPNALQEAKLTAKILLQVHDELIFEVPEAELAATIPVVRATMENAYQLSVPLLTEARVGQNWGELEPVDEDSVLPKIIGES